MAERVAGLILALKTAPRLEVQALRCGRSAIDRRGRHLQRPRFVRFHRLQIGHEQGPAGAVMPLFLGRGSRWVRIVAAEGPLNGPSRRCLLPGRGRRRWVGIVIPCVLKLEAAAHREPLTVTEPEKTRQVGGGKLAQADRHAPAHPLSRPSSMRCSAVLLGPISGPAKQSLGFSVARVAQFG